MGFCELDKIKHENIVPLLRLSMQIVCTERLGLTAEEKKALILDGFSGSTSETDSQYELRTADLLEKFKQEGQIADWVPSERNGTLDNMKTDFVVVRKDTDEAIGLQVTSRKTGAWERRKKIKDMFGEQIIAVVYFKYKNRKDIEEEEIEKRMLAAIYDEGLLTVDIEKPPEKAEPLFAASS